MYSLTANLIKLKFVSLSIIIITIECILINLLLNEPKAFLILIQYKYLS